jgi:Uma2 family endonuclease
MSAVERSSSFDEREAAITTEVIDGLTLMSPRPSLRHALTAIQLGTQLNHRFHRKAGGPPDRPGGWIILFEPELHLDDNVMVPDIAGWRRERSPLLRRENAAATSVPPDWICEVLSGSTEKTDRQRKVPAYHRHGVQHLWLVHPILQTVEIFRRSDAGFVLIGTFCDHDQLRAEPFEVAELALEEVWSADDFAPPAPPAG